MYGSWIWNLLQATILRRNYSTWRTVKMMWGEFHVETLLWTLPLIYWYAYAVQEYASELPHLYFTFLSSVIVKVIHGI